MMPRWHHSDSSSERYQEVKSIKTFYAAHISRSQAESMFDNWTMYQCIWLFVAGIKVAFTVTGSVDIVSGTARFLRVITNIGGQYSTSTGKFTCSLSGIYVFALHIMTSYSSTTAWCKIRKNGSPVVVALTQASESDTYYSSSNSAVLHLVNGDTVDVGYCTSESTIYDSSDYATTFSGFLLQSD